MCHPTAGGGDGGGSMRIGFAEGEQGSDGSERVIPLQGGGDG